MKNIFRNRPFRVWLVLVYWCWPARFALQRRIRWTQCCVRPRDRRSPSSSSKTWSVPCAAHGAARRTRLRRPTRSRSCVTISRCPCTVVISGGRDGTLFRHSSKAMGNEFRDYIFENQLEVNLQNLRAYAEKFAAAHKVDLPYVLDPRWKTRCTGQCRSRPGQGHQDRPHAHGLHRQQPQSGASPTWKSKDSSQLYATIDAVMKE